MACFGGWFGYLSVQLHVLLPAQPGESLQNLAFSCSKPCGILRPLTSDTRICWVRRDYVLP